MWEIRLGDDARLADGSTVDAAAVARSWGALLRRGDPVAEVLLDPVAGTTAFARGTADEWEGLVDRGDVVELRLTRPTPDLPLRLAHPRLAVENGDVSRESSIREGAAAMRDDRVELVDPRGVAAHVLARLGEIDAAIVYGSEASRFVDHAGDAPGGFLSDRAGGWDRTYALWLHPTHRWTRDPSFRRWVSRTVDRQAIVDYLFAGLARPACTLRSVCAPGRVAEPSAGDGPRWEVPRGVHPRVALSFDDGDPHASRIASRVKVDLERKGLVIDLDPRGAAEMALGLERGRVQAAVLMHRPLGDDPVIALLETLAVLRDDVRDAWRLLDDAAGATPRTKARATAASAAESVLVDNARIVPLVVVDAWLVREPRRAGQVARALGLDPEGGGR